jgi:hypothetical protein
MIEKAISHLPRLVNGSVLLLLLAIATVVGSLHVNHYFTRQTSVPPAQIVNGEFTIDEISLPEPGVIQIKVFNGGMETVVIPQVLVDDAYWDFTVVPSTTISATTAATFTLPYPWVTGELHVVRLITSRGETFDGEVVGTEQLATEQ